MRWFSSSMLLRGPVVSAICAAAETGFDGVEVWRDQAVAHDDNPSRLRRALETTDMGVAVHASSYDVNLAAWNPGMRAASLAETVASVHLAADLGAELVVVHPGRRSSSQDDAETWWPHVLSTLEPLDDLAARLGVKVAVELMERRPLEVVMRPDDARRLVAHGFRATGLTVDLAHARTHADPVEFLRDLEGTPVDHVHLSDSDPTTVHLPLGEGSAWLAPALAELARLGYERIITVEGYQPERGRELLAANARALAQLRTSLPGAVHR